MFHYVPYTTALTNYYSDNGPEVNCGPEGRCGSGATGYPLAPSTALILPVLVLPACCAAAR